MMEYVLLNNNVKMPKLGYGVFQVSIGRSHLYFVLFIYYHQCNLSGVSRD